MKRVFIEWHSRGQEFDPPQLHQIMTGVAKTILQPLFFYKVNPAIDYLSLISFFPVLLTSYNNYVILQAVIVIQLNPNHLNVF